VPRCFRDFVGPCAFALLLAADFVAAETAVVRIQTDKPGLPLDPRLFGNNVIATRGAGGPALCDPLTGAWRPRVLEAVQRLRPTVLRFPGGAKSENYFWEEGVGNQTREPDYAFGTDEWLRLCETVGAEPMITVNWLTGSPALAARWVEYCNGSPDSPYGRKRAANGRRQPYGVTTWEIGNEPTHTTQVRDYALTLDAYAHAMKKVDPNIRIGGAAWQWRGWMNHYRPDDVPWTETLLKLAGKHLDFLILHTYLWVSEKPEQVDEGMVEAALAYPEHLDSWLAETRAMCVEAGYPDLPIFVTEYNGYYGESGMSRALLQHFNAVLLCETLNSFIDAGVSAACYWEMVTWGWEHFANIMFADGKHFALRPTYEALKLYRDHVAGKRVPCQVEAGIYDSAKLGVVPAQQAVPSLDVVAAVRDDDAAVVGCVWRRAGEGCTVRLEFAGRPRRVATVYMLLADGPLATNTHVETRSLEIHGGGLSVELPPVSVAVVVAP